MWVGAVADSQTRSKPPFRFPKSHKNPGEGGWVNTFGKDLPKNVFCHLSLVSVHEAITASNQSCTLIQKLILFVCVFKHRFEEFEGFFHIAVILARFRFQFLRFYVWLVFWLILGPFMRRKDIFEQIK